MDELIRELETLENKECMIKFLISMIRNYKEKSGLTNKTK